MATFVLVHSPLTGPFAWEPVAAELRGRGHGVVVPRLTSPPALDGPYWGRHVAEVARAVDDAVAPGRPVVLAGHSGAGPLLPAIGTWMDARVASYVFVDAPLPANNKSRLDGFESDDEADAFRAAAVDGLLRPWTTAMLRPHIDDDATLERFAADLAPVPLAVYEEALPVPPGWPGVPCAYLQFSPEYDGAGAGAYQRGWAYLRLDGSHFHLVNAPAAVAGALSGFARSAR